MIALISSKIFNIIPSFKGVSNVLFIYYGFLGFQFPHPVDDSNTHAARLREHLCSLWNLGGSPPTLQFSLYFVQYPPFTINRSNLSKSIPRVWFRIIFPPIELIYLLPSIGI